ncbi:MAG: glycoside hydrolase family 125 protein, partial [Chloroflexota bacterium]
IPLNYHFSSHILLWHTLRKLQQVFSTEFLASVHTNINPDFDINLRHLESGIPKYFITEHDGKQIYSYATDGEGNHYIYHDANDIPLVMMPLWGFCDKDDSIWRNTIDFAFSDANPGFYDGVLGSVHTPAPWALGDAQELIFCKVIGDRERYQRVWERVGKAAQWDGALPEAYDAQTYEVVSRHWFAWPNAMVAIADGIAWEWETEGEYAR